MGRRVLVTGASGFIGSHLCSQLAGLGCDVHGATRAYGSPETATTIHWVRADLSDMDSTRGMFRIVKPDVVFHLAARVAGARDVELVPSMLTENLLATVNVLMCALEAGRTRVVLAGSMEEPIGASSAPPTSPYAAAKWAASGYARMFHDLYGLSVVTLRVFMVYGPGQRDEQKLIPYTTLSLLRGDAPRLASGARAVDWIYVSDVVDAFLRAAAADDVQGSIDIGSGALVSVRDVVERLVALIDKRIEPQFGAVADRPLETSHSAAVAAAATHLGWRPSTALDDGLRQTVEWYAHRLGIDLPRRST